MTIGLAIVGCGAIGRVRAVLARENPGVGWLGLCDIDEPTLKLLAKDTDADFATLDIAELLGARGDGGHRGHRRARARRPDPAGGRAGFPLFIEKPLATDPIESARVLAAIEAAGIDAVVGYTQRFRRRFLAVKQRLRDEQIGRVTSVVTRAFMNRMVPDATLRKVTDTTNLTPMVVSGTHSLDMSMWLLEGRRPPSRSTPAPSTASSARSAPRTARSASSRWTTERSSA